MNRFALAALLLALGSTTCAAEDETTTSPHRTFTIVQTWSDKGVKQTIRFAAPPTRAITLEESIPWPALYHISPDEHWMLRIQKSGSGDNIAYLYRIESTAQRVWRMEERLDTLGFARLDGVPDLPRSLYHTGIKFGAWDLKRGLLRFIIHGSDTERSGGSLERVLVYRLRDHTVRSP